MSVHLRSNLTFSQLPPPLYAPSRIDPFFLIRDFDHRAFLRITRPAHQLPTNPQNWNPPSPRNHIHSSGFRLRRPLPCISRTPSAPSSAQRLLSPLPLVFLIPVFGSDGRWYLHMTPETIWPYSGNRYSHDLPSQPPAAQHHSPHLAPPIPPPIPPPSCDVDSAEQDAVRYSSKAWVPVPQSDSPATASGQSENYDENLNLNVSYTTFLRPRAN